MSDPSTPNGQPKPDDTAKPDDAVAKPDATAAKPDATAAKPDATAAKTAPKAAAKTATKKKTPAPPPDPTRNNSMKFVTKELYPRIQERFGDAVKLVEQFADDVIEVNNDALLELGFYLRDEDDLDFDFCHCISGVDDGDKGTYSSVLHLTSFSKKHWIVLSASAPKEKPEIPSLCSVWAAAEWHEREAYDLMGIVYTEHPDLRRILCAEEWQGHPLRKDYEIPDHDTVTEWGL